MCVCQKLEVFLAARGVWSITSANLVRCDNQCVLLGVLQIAMRRAFIDVPATVELASETVRSVTMSLTVSMDLTNWAAYTSAVIRSKICLLK